MDEQLSEEEERAEIAAEVFDGVSPVEPAEEPEDKDVIEEVDPLAGVNPALLEKINSIATAVDGLSEFGGRLKQTENRLGNMQNDYYSQKKKTDEAEKALKDAPTAEDLATAAKSKESWEDFEKEFPDMATAIAGRFTTKEDKPDNSGIEKTITDLESKVETVGKGIPTKAQQQISFIEFVHPDWDKVRNSQDYKTWLGDQSDSVKTIHKSSQSASEIVSVLTDFKDFKKTQKTPAQIAEARTKRLEQSKSTTTGKKEKQIKADSDMSEAEIRREEAKKVWG